MCFFDCDLLIKSLYYFLVWSIVGHFLSLIKCRTSKTVTSVYVSDFEFSISYLSFYTYCVNYNALNDIV